jgi:hypothetical protein
MGDSGKTEHGGQRVNHRFMPGLEQRNTKKSEEPEGDQTSEKDGKHKHRFGEFLQTNCAQGQGQRKEEFKELQEFKEFKETAPETSAWRGRYS